MAGSNIDQSPYLRGATMTPQESRALQDFLDQLTQVRGMQKDPQAEAAIARAVSQQPDAAYLLVQRSMLQDQALDSAKAQIAQLQNELQASRAAGAAGGTGASAAARFLDAGSAWGRSAAGRPQPQPEAQSPVMQAAPGGMPMYGPAAGAGRPGMLGGGGRGFLGGGGGGGSFLGNLAATAAGVAGGAFLFQGIQNLMGHDEHGSGDKVASDTTKTDSAPAESSNLADSSSTDTDSAAYDDSGFTDDMDFGGGDEGTSI
jgi:hypothetical protein